MKAAAIALTWCKGAENHVRMKVLRAPGAPTDFLGLEQRHLDSLASALSACAVERYDLRELCKPPASLGQPGDGQVAHARAEDGRSVGSAAPEQTGDRHLPRPQAKESTSVGSVVPELLVVRGGLNELLGDSSSADALLAELLALKWDQEALMYGRVVQKKARHNLVFGGEEDVEPDYAQGQGRIYAIGSRCPLLKQCESRIREACGLAFDPIAEGNLYHDVASCGIGAHGDAERRMVLGMSLGASRPLAFAPFRSSRRVGQPLVVQLSHGDIYAGTAKAFGHDWRRSSVLTFRHAAGLKYMFAEDELTEAAAQRPRKLARKAPQSETAVESGEAQGSRRSFRGACGTRFSCFGALPAPCSPVVL